MKTSRRKSNLKVTLFTRLAMLPLFASVPSPAETFWEEEFNDPYFIAWGGTSGVIPFPGVMEVSTELPYSQTTSLKMTYTGPNGGGFMDRLHPNVEEVYTRFYYRTHAFTYEPTTGTKQFFQENINTPYWYPYFIWENFSGSREMGVAGIGVLDSTCFGADIFETCLYRPNVTHVPLADDRWYCIETHLKMNTPGVANGVIEMWVDGVQTMNYVRRFRGSLVNGPGGNSSLTTFGNIRFYRQAGIGTKYIDLFSVGPTRIGCNGSPPPAPAPEPAPAPTPTPIPNSTIDTAPPSVQILSPVDGQKVIIWFGSN
jgi:hypothetical protein